MLFAILISFLPFKQSSLAAQEDFLTYRTKYRPAEELVVVVNPLMAGKVRVTSFDNKVVMSGTKESLAAAKAILEELDRKPRTFQLESRLVENRQENRSGVAVEAEGDLFGRLKVAQRSGIGQRNAHRLNVGGVSVSGGESEGRGQGNSLRTVQALEGRNVVLSYPHSKGESTLLLKVRAGTEMRVTVSVQEQGPGNLSLLSTEVTTTLGSWISLGSLQQAGSGNNKEILASEKSSSAATREFQIRVLESK